MTAAGRRCATLKNSKSKLRVDQGSQSSREGAISRPNATDLTGPRQQENEHHIWQMVL
jgi:hypothetical protein